MCESDTVGSSHTLLFHDPRVLRGNKCKLPPSESLAALFSRASGLPDWMQGQSPLPTSKLRPGSAPTEEPLSHILGQTS